MSATSVADRFQLVNAAYVEIAAELPRLRDVSARVLQKCGEPYERLGACALSLLERLRDAIEDRHADELHLLLPLLQRPSQRTGNAEDGQQLAAVRTRLELEQLVTMETLDELRKLTGNYSVPPAAAEALRELYDGLAHLDDAVQRQFALENSLVLRDLPRSPLAN